MEIKFKFGDIKFKISHKDFMKKLSSSGNPFEMLLKSNMELYARYFGDMPQNMLDQYKEFSKVFANFLDITKSEIGKIPEGPDILPVNGHDIYNYVGRYEMGNFHSQAILRLDGRLDFDKLKKAVRLSFDAEPVLGCRFVEGNPPYWKRLKNIDEMQFCSLEEASDVPTAVQGFLESRLDMDNDSKIKVKLIRSESCDILGIKANHACCDGTGIKEYVQLLSDIYSKIIDPDGTYEPIPATRGRGDQDRLLKILGIDDPNAYWIPGSDISIPTWAFPWEQETSSSFRIVISRIPQDELDIMHSYAKSKGATINDLILTAYYRAMLCMGQPVYGVPMGINVTIDLRRYLPDNKTEAIRNFSGSTNTWLTMVENEAFSDTLSRVVYMMNEVKKGYPGLQSAIGLERLEKISFRDTLAYYNATAKVGKKMPHSPAFYGNRCIPALSNLGVLSKSLLKFDNATVEDYFIIPPVVSPPGILLVANTYNGIMTLGAGYFEYTVLQDDVKRLIDKIRDELLGGCRL